jgi:methyl-accepting chemotaxis protein
MKFQLPEKYNSISFKASFFTGILIFISFTVIITYTTISFIQAEVAASQESLIASSKEIASTIKVRIDKAFDLSRFSGNMLIQSKRSASSMLSREEVVEQLKNQVRNNSDILSTYTLWEPNAYDGKDSSYVNGPYHDATGRFVPYIVRSKGDLRLEALMYYDTNTPDGEYYQLPKRTKKEALIEPIVYPVDGVDILMISTICPVITEDKFLGITGCDFSVDFIQELVESQTLGKGQARVAVLSHTGKIVAMKGHAENINKYMKDLPNTYEKTFDPNLNDVSIYQSNGRVKVAVPIRLGNTDTPWQVTVSVPESMIKESAYALSWKLILVGLTFLGGLLAFLIIFLKRMLEPMNAIIQAAEKVVEGDLDYKLVKSESIEIKKMNSAFTEIIDNQREITEVCVSISKGDFSKKAIEKGEKDVLAKSVNVMIDNLKKAAEEDHKRRWASEGLAKFAEILRSDNDLKILSEAVLSHLIKYIQANQGGLFLVNDEDKNDVHLELFACYAFNRKKHLERRVEIGAGLVGQCYLEREIIFLTEVPNDYISITSGLGDANPRCILIVPLIVNEKILGIMELASFHPLDQHEILFVQKLAESIASTVAGVKVNQRTRKLLEVSQQQAEEMRAQEEEMRQNMEELTATQEEVQRKEEAYKAEIQRLYEELAHNGKPSLEHNEEVLSDAKHVISKKNGQAKKSNG